MSIAADEIGLKHARAFLKLLREREALAGRRGERPAEATLDVVLRSLDLDWPNLLKAQHWCASRACDLEEAALLCQEFASAAPDLLSLRLTPEEWLAWLQAGLDTTQRSSDDTARRKLLENLGHAHLKNGNPSQARACFDEQLSLAGLEGERSAAGKALCSLANIASLSGMYAEAECLFKRALEVAREIRIEQLEADVLGNLAILCDDAGRPEEAVEAYRRALEVARRIGDRAGEGRHLGNLAGLYKHTAETGKAIDLYREQLGIARDLKDRKTQAGALHNLGLIYLDWDELEVAAEAFEEALMLRRRVGDRLGEGKELGALGIIFRRKGDRSAAVEHLTRWLQIARESGNRLEEAEALNNLGNAAESPDSSRAFYEESLVIVRELGHPRGLAILLNNLARLYDLAGDTKRAQEVNAEAVQNHRQAGNPIGEARSLWHLAKIAFRIGEVEKAFSWGYQALDIYCQLQQRDWALDLVYMIGNWVVEHGDYELRQAYEEKVARALEGFTDAKTEWIRMHVGL